MNISTFANRKQNAFISARKRGYTVNEIRFIFAEHQAQIATALDELRRNKGLFVYNSAETARIEAKNIVRAMCYHTYFPQFFN